MRVMKLLERDITVSHKTCCKEGVHTMQPYRDDILAGLDYALQDNVTIQGPRGAVRLSHFPAGDLVVTSGVLVPYDPLWVEELIHALVTHVPTGRYPIILSIWHQNMRYQTTYKQGFALLAVRQRETRETLV